MAIIFLRSTIIFLTLLVIMRFMGKRQIGEMQPFEFIITLIVADLACIPMTDISIPLIYGIISILALFVLHQTMSFLEKSGITMKKIICGSPSIVITPDGVDVRMLKKNNLSVDDLVETMRIEGYFCLSEILYGIFETNGKLTTIKNDKAEPCKTIPYLIVNEGKIDAKNLEVVGLSKDFIHSQGKLKDIMILTATTDGNIYLQLKGKKFKKFNCKTKEAV